MASKQSNTVSQTAAPKLALPTGETFVHLYHEVSGKHFTITDPAEVRKLVPLFTSRIQYASRIIARSAKAWNDLTAAVPDREHLHCYIKFTFKRPRRNGSIRVAEGDAIMSDLDYTLAHAKVVLEQIEKFRDPRHIVKGEEDEPEEGESTPRVSKASAVFA